MLRRAARRLSYPQRPRHGGEGPAGTFPPRVPVVGPAQSMRSQFTGIEQVMGGCGLPRTRQALERLAPRPRQQWLRIRSSSTTRIVDRRTRAPPRIAGEALRHAGLRVRRHPRHRRHAARRRFRPTSTGRSRTGSLASRAPQQLEQGAPDIRGLSRSNLAEPTRPLAKELGFQFFRSIHDGSSLSPHATMRPAGNSLMADRAHRTWETQSRRNLPRRRGTWNKIEHRRAPFLVRRRGCVGPATGLGAGGAPTMVIIAFYRWPWAHGCVFMVFASVFNDTRRRHDGRRRFGVRRRGTDRPETAPAIRCDRPWTGRRDGNAPPLGVPSKQPARECIQRAPAG
jgi:hypothetical protein